MLTMTRVLIVHGYAGSGRDHWQTWLAEQCKAAGLKTYYPELPEPYRPILADWIQALKAEVPQIDAQTALVGHSLGCAAIFHRLQGKDIRSVGRVVLVAPAKPEKVAESKLAFLKPFYQDMRPEATRQKAEKIDVFASDDDQWMSMDESAALAKELDATLHTFVDGGHLSINAGFHTFPEVLDAILDKN